MSSIRVFLLGSLAERGPMHGHQLRLLAEKEHVHNWTDFGVGGLYGALKRLRTEGLIEPVRTERDGARPERQIVRITDEGTAALDVLRRATLETFDLRPDPFDLAMARLGREVLAELPEILARRGAAVASAIDEQGRRFREIDPRLTLAERHVMHHAAFRLRAERDWLDAVLADLPAIVRDEQTREAD